MRSFRRGSVRVGQGMVLALGCGAGTTLLATGDAAAKGQLKTIVLPDYYRLEVNSQVILQLSNGDQIRLQSDQYIMLEDGLLLIVDEFAQSSLSILPVQGAIRTQLWTSSLPIMTADGGVIMTADSQPVWPDSALGTGLFENLSINRYELAQNEDSSGGGADAGGNAGSGAGGGAGAGAGAGVGVGAGVGALGVAGIASGIASLNQARPETDEKSVAATTVAPAITLKGLGPVWPDASIPNDASFVLKAEKEDEFIGYDYPNTLAASAPLTVNQLVEDGLTFGENRFEAKFDMRVGGDKWLLIAGKPDVFSSEEHFKFTYKDSPEDDTIEVGGNFGIYHTAKFDMSSGGYNHLSLGSKTYLASQFKYIGGAGTDTIGAGAFFGEYSTVKIDNSAGGTNRFETGTSLESSYFDYIGGRGNDTLEFTPLGDASIIIDDPAGTNRLAVDDMALQNGDLEYHDGLDDDTLEFGTSFGEASEFWFKAYGGTNLLYFDEGALKNGSFEFARAGASSSNTIVLENDFGQGATIEIDNWTNDIDTGSFLLDAKDGFASSSGKFDFYGGPKTNSLFFENGFVSDGGVANIFADYAATGTIFQTHDGAAQDGGEIKYHGGPGQDILVFGDDLALQGGSVTIKLGNASINQSGGSNVVDQTADQVNFLGSVGDPIDTNAISDSTEQAAVSITNFGAGDYISLQSMTDVNDLTITPGSYGLHNVKNASETINFNVYVEEGSLSVVGPGTATGVTLVNSMALPMPPVTISFAASSISSLLLIPSDTLI